MPTWNREQDQLERKNRALEDELAAERVLSKQLRMEIDRLKDDKQVSQCTYPQGNCVHPYARPVGFGNF